eukprot:3673436-Pyramimonas_sp.AAC.2
MGRNEDGGRGTTLKAQACFFSRSTTAFYSCTRPSLCSLIGVGALYSAHFCIGHRHPPKASLICPPICTTALLRFASFLSIMPVVPSQHVSE